MPARPSHIPHAIERSALQNLKDRPGLSLINLETAGKRTIGKMLDKGWIEQRLVDGGVRYFITSAGTVALRAIIPGKR